METTVFCAQCGTERVVETDDDGNVIEEVKKCACPDENQPDYPNAE
jgi:uncharacterized Zn finger protein (UPF0148 family)